MAYAALLSLTQTLEQILGSPHEETLEQILVSGHEETQIKSLHEKLSFLLSFLEDSSHKNTETITCLEVRIRDATYEAEDIIDHSHMSKQIDSESASQGVISRSRKFILPGRRFKEKYIGIKKELKEKYIGIKTYIGLKKVLDEIDSILVEVEKMKDMNDTEGSSKPSSSNKSAVVGSDDELMQIKDPLSGLPSKFKSTSIFGKEGIEEEVKTNDLNDVQDLRPRKSLGSTSSKLASTKKNAMVGFEDYLLPIKEQLVGQSNRLEIISIVGMGGIGKTTLARNIYSDLYIEHHFDIRAWTTLSQKYHVQKLLVDLLKSMGDHSYQLNPKGTEELKMKLYQTLKGKRYLIVMDDVWDANALDEFRRIFPDDHNGSRIILTSRLSNVVVHADSSSPIHHLSFLNPKQSWNLLCQKVFGKECCPPELQEIGKRIAEKCKGLPLALVVIGGLLYKAEKTIAQWEYVAENIKSAVTGNSDDFMEIMSWSYNHLPHHLRACFLYIAVFPEDYVIPVSRLIWLWVAEGFLKPVTTKSLEEVAKEYLKELIDRNLIMVRDRIKTGEIKTCSIHDLMRELCMRKAQDEKFLYVNQEVKSSLEVMKNQRRLSIHKKMRHHKYYSTFRSLLYFTDSLFSYDRSFQMLRVLEAGTISFDKFPTEIVKLVNLRYIALSYTGIFKIPASISNLCNLQTLIVFGKSWGRKLFLPEELLKMPCLRHLLFDEGVLLCSHRPQNANLQTLCGVKDFRFTEEALQIIRNLKTLGTFYDFDIGNETELSFYCLENLVHLHQLESFKCVISGYWRHFSLPQNLAFPPNLKKLTLSGFRISLDNMSVVGSLPNLEVLQLKMVSFKRNAWKTKEGEFSRLKFLLVEDPSLKIWEADEEIFPGLECLCLRQCKYLDRIPSEIGEISTLQLIILYDCSSSAVTSANKILEEQQDLGNDYLEVRSYSKFNGYKDSGYSYHKMHGPRHTFSTMRE